MRYQARFTGLEGAWLLFLALGTLLGCSWKGVFAPNIPTLPNAVAVDRALELCSLPRGGEPFHLILLVTPPALGRSAVRSTGPFAPASMQAQIEVWWLNAITYRVVIHSPRFSQTRIVNGQVVEEHDTGDFYPRWLQNFVDAIFDPVPHAAALRRQPGAVPVSIESHACIAASEFAGGAWDEAAAAQVCFQDREPRLASGVDFTRYVSFDNFEPFGSQQIARTLINDLPANLLIRGRIIVLEPLPRSAYPLLKATRFTPLTQQIQTKLVAKAVAQSLLESAPAARLLESNPGLRMHVQRSAVDSVAGGEDRTGQDRTTVYVRTDRTGRVREAYSDSTDIYGLHRAAVDRALGLKFKPLIVDGAPRQMEAPVDMR